VGQWQEHAEAVERLRAPWEAWEAAGAEGGKRYVDVETTSTRAGSTPASSWACERVAAVVLPAAIVPFSCTTRPMPSPARAAAKRTLAARSRRRLQRPRAGGPVMAQPGGTGGASGAGWPVIGVDDGVSGPVQPGVRGSSGENCAHWVVPSVSYLTQAPVWP
jgi:hypothetical protein